PPRYKDDELTITENHIKTSENVDWSIFDWAGDVSSDIKKLNSSDAINSLVNLINPFLAQPFQGRLYQKENMTYREMLVERIVEQSKKLIGPTAQNEFITESFLSYYKVGFSSSELINLAESLIGPTAKNKLLYMGAQAYLYSFKIDELNQVANASVGPTSKNKILHLISQKSLLGSDKVVDIVREIPGYATEDIERSRYISKLIQVAKGTRTSAAEDEILFNGLRNNLEREFSLVDILRIARATRTSRAQDRILLFAARAYRKKWSQSDLHTLARATRTSSAEDEVTMIRAEMLGATNRFYNRDVKPGYSDYDSDYDTKSRYQKPQGKSKVSVKIEGSGDAEVDIRINQN
ncbi:hypothetical protein MJH12_15065, partial [bacterium]|nr:hypothetical protein [bacterium]